MDIRAHPISFSERPREAGRATRSRMRRRDRFSISSFQLADLGGKANYCYRDQLQTWGGGHPLLGCGLRDARLIAALLCQHGPHPSTTVITFRQRLDLIGHGFNSLVEPPPVTSKFSDDAHHAR